MAFQFFVGGGGIPFVSCAAEACRLSVCISSFVDTDFGIPLHRRSEHRVHPMKRRIAATRDDAEWQLRAEFFFRYHSETLLWQPKTLLQRRDEAVVRLSEMGDQVKNLNLSGRDGEVCSALARAGFAAMTGLLDFLMAVGTVDEGFNISLAMLLPAFRNEVERDCRCVAEDQNAGPVIEAIEAGDKTQITRWKGHRTRGLAMNAPGNRLVFRLLERIDYWKEAWEALAESGVVVPKTEKRKFKASLHLRLRQMIDLPALAPGSALKYHRVGLAMLKDAADPRGTGDLTRHPAFQRGGEFPDVVAGSKTFAGALNEAWRSVARRKQADELRKSPSKQE